jgi:hypothetical protein
VSDKTNISSKSDEDIDSKHEESTFIVRMSDSSELEHVVGEDCHRESANTDRRSCTQEEEAHSDEQCVSDEECEISSRSDMPFYHISKKVEKKSVRKKMKQASV